MQLPASGPATSLRATTETATSITIEWHAPRESFKPTFQVRYRIKGRKAWTLFPTKTTATHLTITGLKPKTTYEIEVLTTNGH